MSRHQSDRRLQTTPDGGQRTIVIGWQVIVIPLLIVAIVGGGFLFGRVMAQRDAAARAASAPTAAPQESATQAGGQVMPLDPSQIATLQAAQDPSRRYDPNTIYDLPRLPHPLLGKEAPDFTVTDFATGTEAHLSDYRGTPVLLSFWGTWCGPCRIEMPWIQAVFEKYMDQGFTVLGYSVGDKYGKPTPEEDVREFLNQYGITFPVLVTDQANNLDIQQQWQIAGYPSAFMIDKDGVVADYHRSMFPNQVTLESRLAGILPGADAEG